ncbi:MAG: ribulose-phosphate 3-epimerase [Salibacteraceae bacterium]
MMKIISPSILNCDFGRLNDEIAFLNESQAKWIHLDVMDGIFVPNISFGLPVISAVRKATTKTLDVHLMIANPDRYIESFKDAGADVLTVHLETCPHLNRTLCSIKDAGMKAGVAVNPHTSVALLEEVLELADVLLVMSVNPGFGGQSFIPSTVNKVKRLREMLRQRGSNAFIEVDGGVTPANASMLWDAGANILVAGSAVFNAPDRHQVIEQLLV